MAALRKGAGDKEAPGAAGVKRARRNKQ